MSETDRTHGRFRESLYELILHTGQKGLNVKVE